MRKAFELSSVRKEEQMRSLRDEKTKYKRNFERAKKRLANKDIELE